MAVKEQLDGGSERRSRRMSPERARRYLRITIWSAVWMFVAAMVLPLGAYVYVGVSPAQAAEGEQAQGNPRANYWRAVRGGVSGYTAVTGKAEGNDWKNMETNALIQNGGQNWRQLRNGILANYGGWFLFGALLAVLAFFAVRGQVKIEGGRSGKVVARWSWWERLLHWSTATMFVVLTVTGLSLLFGRAILIPLLGPEGFSVWAGLCISLHDFFGPFFGLGVALMVIFWFGHNLPTAEDVTWFVKGGGIWGKAHPSAGYANGGEKVWFWFVLIGGGAVVFSGLFMAGTIGEQTRASVQTANLIHGAAGIAWIAFWIGHAYIGTIGSEGSLEAMTRGYVDENWAKQHHDQWHATVADAAIPVEQTTPVGGVGAGSAEGQASS